MQAHALYAELYRSSFLGKVKQQQSKECLYKSLTLWHFLALWPTTDFDLQKHKKREEESQILTILLLLNIFSIHNQECVSSGILLVSKGAGFHS